MKRPHHILTLLIFAVVTWSGVTIYKCALKKQENGRKIEDYRRRMNSQKKLPTDLENGKRASRSQPGDI